MDLCGVLWNEEAIKIPVERLWNRAGEYEHEITWITLMVFIKWYREKINSLINSCLPDGRGYFEVQQQRTHIWSRSCNGAYNVLKYNNSLTYTSLTHTPSGQIVWRYGRISFVGIKSLVVELSSASSLRMLYVFGLLLRKMAAVIEASSWIFLP